MSPVQDEDVDVDWKAVIALLRDGKTVELPCEKERDYIRRENQVVKRAEKKGIAVAVHRGDGVLRVEPRLGSVPESTAPAATEFQGERQQERQQRREVLRAERRAEHGRDD